MGRIFLAGASGVIGRRLVPMLRSAGHAVVALTRHERNAASLREMGVEAVVADVFDRARIREIVEAERPDAVIHQLTAIPPTLNPRHVARQMEPTNRIRREATEILLDAARAAGVRRFVAQSISFVCRPEGPPLSTEDEPLFLDAPTPYRGVIAAVSALEKTTLSNPDVEGVVLRYGFFHGPGTIYAPGGPFAEDVQRRRIPIVGEGAGVFSFVHVDDAARATLLALEQEKPGIYNIVDDRPLAVSDWLPRYAAALGAPPPWHIPRWLGRLGAGPYGDYLMCVQRGASNAKARRVLGFEPQVPDLVAGLAS
ncbi:MAG: NAD(P)-dependent oxidoreductase [Myxococcales bacterium]|nr:NAD(P)-dependent oxidoreductase [Myxococcales bacterium]